MLAILVEALMEQRIRAAVVDQRSHRRMHECSSSGNEGTKRFCIESDGWKACTPSERDEYAIWIHANQMRFRSA